MRARPRVPLRRGGRHSWMWTAYDPYQLLAPKAHHILAEIIQGGLVLETNVLEIDRAGKCSPTLSRAMHVAQRFSTRGGLCTCSARRCQSTERIVRICKSALSYRRWGGRFSGRRTANSARMVGRQIHRSRGEVAVSYRNARASCLQTCPCTSLCHASSA